MRADPKNPQSDATPAPKGRDAVPLRIVEEVTETTKVPRLWSARALADRWKISRQQIYRAYKRERLPGFRVLGTLRFHEEDVLALLRQEGFPLEDR